MPAVYNNEIQDLAVQITAEAGMEDQSAAVSTIQKNEAPPHRKQLLMQMT